MKTYNPQNQTPKLILQITLTLILLAIIPLSYPFTSFSKLSPPPSPSSLSSTQQLIRELESEKPCDIFSGKWVPNPEAPYYTNTTCWAIHEHQNCMKYGRPDSEFMKWRWKPDGCDLSVFNPAQFLEIVRGKSLAFVGDSVARNQMQSLMCLLSRVEYPVDISETRDENFKQWNYTTYNFTLSTFWSPHLVKSKPSNTNATTATPGLFDLYLDQPDTNWTTKISNFDYIIISSGHWFFRPMLFFQNNTITSCRFCEIPNITDLPLTYAYRKSFKTAFNSILQNPNFKGITYLRTFAPSHFENGLWNEGGNCVRTKPFEEKVLEGVDFEMYMVQLEEFRVGEREGRRRNKKFRLIDVTQAMLLRGDGHPSRFGHWKDENVSLYNDCVHWCLPGPIDVWNDFLLDLLKMEGVRSKEEMKMKMKMKMRF